MLYFNLIKVLIKIKSIKLFHLWNTAEIFHWNILTGILQKKTVREKDSNLQTIVVQN